MDSIRQPVRNYFTKALEQYDGWDPTYYKGKLYSWVAGNFREHDPDLGTVLWSTNLPWVWAGYDMNRTVAIDRGPGLFHEQRFIELC